MSSNYNLSEGALKTIMMGGEVTNPIMQVLGAKKINSGHSEKERFRVLLSDGIYTISFAMFTTSINDQVGSAGVQTNTIIKLSKYITSVINNADKGDTRVLLIMEMEVVAPGSVVGGKLGSPVPLPDVNTSQSCSAASRNNTLTVANGTSSTRNDTMGEGNSVGNLNGQLTHPISSLSPYHNKWVIKARVFNKSAIRTWSNSRGEGKLFSMDLIDDSGEIRCTAFREVVDKFYEYIQVDKIYYISKCILKPANKQFSSLKNDYEMTMSNETVVQLCEDSDDKIPQVQYDFLTIDKIGHMEVNTLVDVIGICQNTGELMEFKAKNSGRDLKRKEVTLVDQSKTAISLTLWGNDAVTFDGSQNPVIVVKGARIGEFGGGKTLSLVAGSQFRLNPELPESYRIRGWYDSEGSSLQTTNISSRSGSGNFNTQWMSFKEVSEQGLGQSEKGDYYQVVGTILLIRSENAVYKACPTEECNKKVVDLENGMYRCEKCNREYPNFKYRLLASMNVGDWSGNQWVSMFSSEVEKVLGVTSQEIGMQLEQNKDALMNIAEKSTFKQFVLKCRAKIENYNDEARLKTVVVNVEPVNYAAFNENLIDKIKQLVA